MEYDNFGKRLQYLLSFIAIFAPIFYLIGLSYHQTILNSYGLDPGLFPITLQDTYVAAYIAVTRLLLPIYVVGIELFSWISENKLSTLLRAIAALSLLAVLIFCIKISIKSIYYQTVTKFIQSKLFTHTITQSYGLAGIISYLVMAFLYIPFALICLWILPTVLGAQAAKTYVNEKINDYTKYGCYFKENSRWSNCRILQSSGGKALYQGILIAQTENHIAFYTQTGTVLLTLSDDYIILNKPKDL